MSIVSKLSTNTEQQEINMIWTDSYDVVVKETTEAVLVPLKNGICSLNMVNEALINADVDPFSNKCSNFSYIRQQIVEAEWNLRQAEQVANSGLRRLDGTLEKLLQDEGQLEREKRTTEQTLDDLKLEQSSNEKLLKESERGLEDARANLNCNKRVLEARKEEKNAVEVLTKVGLGVTLIPVVGWITGPAMVVSGAIVMNIVEKQIREAKEEVRNCKCQLEKYKSKVSNSESTISKTKHDISKKNDKLQSIRSSIHNMKKQRGNVAEFQGKVRSAVQVLSILSGRARVAKSHTRRCIFWEPMIKVMDDVMKAAEKITGNELLYNNGMLYLITNMRQNSHQLTAMCASQSDAELMNYY